MRQKDVIDMQFFRALKKSPNKPESEIVKNLFANASQDHPACLALGAHTSLLPRCLIVVPLLALQLVAPFFARSFQHAQTALTRFAVGHAGTSERKAGQQVEGRKAGQQVEGRKRHKVSICCPAFRRSICYPAFRSFVPARPTANMEVLFFGMPERACEKRGSKLKGEKLGSKLKGDIIVL